MQTSTAAQNEADSLRTSFVKKFGKSPRIFRAPARVNLIGEHTDYNDGFVMPAAIDFYTWVAASPRTDDKLVARSDHFGETVELELNALAGPPRRHWSDYVRGVAAEVGTFGKVVGADLLIRSDVPLGAGLSSSAALEISIALELSNLSDLRVPSIELVKLSQRAEHRFAGTLCGIMDQFVATFGEAGSALLLDCRSLEYRMVPIPSDMRLVICNSMVKHELASGEYNKRRSGCESAVRELRKVLKGIRALRDVTSAQLEQFRSLLSEEIYHRAKHVISENERAEAAGNALSKGDTAEFGRLMYASHESLKKDYEVSCEELDLLVELASKFHGVIGARMTGGGFGGCTVNLVREEVVEEFSSVLPDQYRKCTGVTPCVYVCQASKGAGPVLVP